MSSVKLERDSVIKKLTSVIIREPNVVIAGIGLILLVVVLSILSPHFMTQTNIFNVLRQVSIIAIVSIGMTYVIIAGGIDLSVGSVAGLCGVTVAILIKSGINMFLAVIMGLIIGATCGAINGFLITSRIKMPPVIATLALMAVARGVTLVISGGIPIYGLPKIFGYIAGGYVFNIPIPVIILILMYIIAYTHLTYSKEGVYYYAVGGNAEASRLAGVPVNWIKTKTYIITGTLSAIAGVILASRMVSIEPLAGTGFEMDAIAAVVIGGTNMYGGEGSILGTFIGALIIAVLRNGSNLLDVSPYWQQILIGLVIAGTLSLNALRRRT